MTETAKVQYGPFAGYVSSMPKHMIPVNAAAEDSRDYELSPTEGKWVERNGSTPLGGTAGLFAVGSHATTFKARQLFELPNALDDTDTAVFADGYPSYACHFGLESTGAGALYFRSSNSGGSNQVPGLSFSTTTYPTTGRNGNKSYFKAVNMWSALAASPLHRGKSDTNRGVMYAGTRRAIVSGKWHYAPNKLADPRAWNMVFNDSSSSPTRRERHVPWGLIPPLQSPLFKNSDLPTPTTSVAPWRAGERFYASYCFIFEDGSWSRPYLPAAKTDAADADYFVNHFGLVTLPSMGASPNYASIKWRFAKGPPGTIARALLRSPKVDSSLGLLPVINDLRITAIIPNNTATTYVDTGGDDVALVVDEERVRFDQIWAKRGKYAWTFDGRVAIGGSVKSNPSLIILSVTGKTATGDITNDDDATMTTDAWVFRIVGSSLQLRYIDGSGSFPAAPATTTITLSSSKTLNDIVAEINATTPASTGKEWRAVIAPGADGSLSSDLLPATSTYDHGDDALVNDATTGNIQVFCQAWPGIIYTATLTGDPTDNLGFWHTSNTPASATVGITGAARNFRAGNYRQPPDADSGNLMGGVALTDGAVVFYSKKVWLFRNTFAGRSGRDEDYRFDLLSNDGCIAWDSIGEINGCAHWLSAKGMLVTAGQPGDQVLISGANYDPNTGVGDWSYEIGQSIAASAADNDAGYFSAKVIGHVLEVSYRSSSSATRPDFKQRYDFSAGAPAGGIAGIVRSDGSPYGWSAPAQRSGSTIGFFRKSTGVVRLNALDGTSGASGVGRIDQFDTGYTDNGIAITPVLYLKQNDMGQIRRRHRLRKVAVQYKSPTGHELTMTHSRDRARASATDYTIDNTNAAEVGTMTKRIKLRGLSPARVSELSFSGTRVTAGAAEIWQVEADVKILDTPVDYGG